MLKKSLLPVLATIVLATVATAASPKIAWYGKLEDGLAEAKRSNRPILLVSAAPQCQNVAGMW